MMLPTTNNIPAYAQMSRRTRRSAGLRLDHSHPMAEPGREEGWNSALFAIDYKWSVPTEDQRQSALRHNSRLASLAPSASAWSLTQTMLGWTSQVAAKLA